MKDTIHAVSICYADLTVAGLDKKDDIIYRYTMYSGVEE